MYKVELSSEEMELLLTALRYTTEYGYTHAHDINWEEGLEEYHAMYRVYDKLIDERNRV